MEKVKNQVEDSKVKAGRDVKIGDFYGFSGAVVLLLTSMILLFSYAIIHEIFHTEKEQKTSIPTDNPAIVTNAPDSNLTAKPLDLPPPKKSASTPPKATPQKMYLGGKVLAEDNTPLAGIEVSDGNNAVKTDIDGKFFLPIVALSSTSDVSVSYSGQGYQEVRTYANPRKKNLIVNLQK